jgi:four helix bundle protein
MTSFHSFEELEAWKSARDLRKWVINLVKKFPSEEKFRLTDQILRSSRSVPANIAEGFGRFHYQENAQYCRQARGSLFETLEHIICANDSAYINEQDVSDGRNHVNDCMKKLNGYISYLSRSAKQNKVAK